MPRMHEIVAIGTGKKTETEAAITEFYHVAQKGDLFDAVQKTYRPAAEGGEQLPPETKRAQQNLPDLVRKVCGKWIELFDVVLSMDSGNQVAKADIQVPDGPTVKGVPVPTLLFLEKQLDNARAFVQKLPTPDPSDLWTHNPTLGMLVAEPTETYRTKKEQKPLVLYPATDKHPAQTQLITEDVVVGFWKTQKLTSRIPADQKAEMLDRLDALRDAVKTARERANAAEVEWRRMGAELIGFVFGPMAK